MRTPRETLASSPKRKLRVSRDKGGSAEWGLSQSRLRPPLARHGYTHLGARRPRPG
jgi:hypothetical protein